MNFKQLTLLAEDDFMAGMDEFVKRSRPIYIVYPNYIRNAMRISIRKIPIESLRDTIIAIDPAAEAKFEETGFYKKGRDLFTQDPEHAKRYAQRLERNANEHNIKVVMDDRTNDIF